MQPLEFLNFTYGPFAENTYVVVGPSGRKAMLVDPGMGSEPVWDVLTQRGLPSTVLLCGWLIVAFNSTRQSRSCRVKRGMTFKTQWWQE